MNIPLSYCASFNNQTNETSTDVSIEQFIDKYGKNFIIVPICCVGFVLNFTSLVILFHPKVNSPAMRSYQAKTIVELVCNCIGILITTSTCSFSENTSKLLAEIYVIYLDMVVYDAMYVFNSFTHVLIVYDGYLLLNQSKSKWCCQVPSLVLIFISLIVSICSKLPTAFAYTVEQHTDDFSVRLNSFGESNAFFFFNLASNIVLEVGFYVSLLIFSILFIRNYRRFMSKKTSLVSYAFSMSDGSSSLSGRQNSTKFSETHKNTVAKKSVTSMIIKMCVIYLISRLTTLASIVQNFVLTFEQSDSLFNQALHFAAHIMVHIAQSIGFFIYYRYNILFYNVFNEMFKKIFKIKQIG